MTRLTSTAASSGSNPSFDHGASLLRRDVFAPFLLTRLLLLLVAWFSRYLPRNAHYPVPLAVARGWEYSPHRLLDVWGRWDTGWYFQIVRDGYSAATDLLTTQSNIAFFPLYPLLVKAAAFLVPPNARTPGAILFVGVVLSNLFLVGALAVLHALITSSLGDRALARRTIRYLLLFPTSVFFSCFFTESMFLFLSVAAFLAAMNRRWLLAGIAGGLLALTRPLGIVILIPLLWIYLEAVEWRLRRIRRDVACLLLIPAGFSVFLFVGFFLAGDFLAPIKAQAAWGRALVMPWKTLVYPVFGNAWVTPIHQALAVLSLMLTFLAAKRFTSKSYALYSLLLLIPPLFSGTLQSSGRFFVVVFPLFVVMAGFGRSRIVDRGLMALFVLFQALFMAAWSQFYYLA
jgi:hypothetical protein